MGGRPKATLHYAVTISVDVAEPVLVGRPVEEDGHPASATRSDTCRRHTWLLASTSRKSPPPSNRSPGSARAPPRFVGVAADVTGPWDPDSRRRDAQSSRTATAYVQAGALEPRPVNSWTEFTQAFGDLQAGNQYLAHAVYGFFNNGGGRCWVIRVAPGGRDFTKNVDTRAAAVREHRRDRHRRRSAARRRPPPVHSTTSRTSSWRTARRWRTASPSSTAAR